MCKHNIQIINYFGMFVAFLQWIHTAPFNIQFYVKIPKKYVILFEIIHISKSDAASNVLALLLRTWAKNYNSSKKTGINFHTVANLFWPLTFLRGYPNMCLFFFVLSINDRKRVWRINVTAWGCILCDGV